MGLGFDEALYFLCQLHGLSGEKVMLCVTCMMLLNYFGFILVKFSINKSLDFNFVA